MFVYLYKTFNKKLYRLHNEDTLSICYLLDWLAIYILLIFIWLHNDT